MVAKQLEISTTEALRNFAAAKGCFKRKEAVTALGITPKQADSAISNLLGIGHLTRLSMGQYQFCTVHEDNRMVTLEEKLWRAMRAKRTFTAADLAKLVESSTAHVYKFVRRYVADGYVRQQGRKRTMDGGTAKLYRLTVKGRSKARAPKQKEFKPAPVIMDVVELNRLVCSGVTQVDEKAANQGIVLCKNIMKHLEESLDV
nr:hypothetical protein [uncultured Desulfobacter sp.]